MTYGKRIKTKKNKEKIIALFGKGGIEKEKIEEIREYWRMFTKQIWKR